MSSKSVSHVIARNGEYVLLASFLQNVRSLIVMKHAIAES
jgi:hypothetical protein